MAGFEKISGVRLSFYVCWWSNDVAFFGQVSIIYWRRNTKIDVDLVLLKYGILSPEKECVFRNVSVYFDLLTLGFCHVFQLGFLAAKLHYWCLKFILCAQLVP